MSLDYDPHDLAGQRLRSERERARDEERANRLIADVKWLMSGPRGRRFLRALLDETGVPHGEVFHENPYVMAKTAGRQSVGRRFYQLILEHAQAEFPLLLKEDNVDRDTGTEE